MRSGAAKRKPGPEFVGFLNKLIRSSEFFVVTFEVFESKVMYFGIDFQTQTFAHGIRSV
jgi:hypothetical protein